MSMMSMQQQGTYYYKNKKTRRRSIKIGFRNWIYLLLATETHIFSKTRYVCLDNFIIGDSKIERMGAQEGDELKQQVTRTGIKYNSCKAIKQKTQKQEQERRRNSGVIIIIISEAQQRNNQTPELSCK